MDTSHEEPPMTESAPASPGELLRNARESFGHSLEDAAEATKISKTYLRALEENRFQELPSPAYLKGFLRIYANYLKLNADDLATMIATDNAQESSAIAEPAPEKSGMPLLQRAQRFALPLALLGALILSAVILQPAIQETPVKTEAPPQSPAQPVPQQALQAASSSSSTQTITASTASTTEPAPPPPAEESVTPQPPLQQPASGFMVRMKVLKNGTLTVTIDDTVSQNYQLTSGDLIEWKAAANLALDLSDSGGVELELNGKPVRHQAAPGKSAHLVLGAEGIRP